MDFVVFVVSDGTGRTARQALAAALTQFPGVQINVRVRAEIRTKEEIKVIINEVLEAKAFILHTIVQSEIRNELVRNCRMNNIEAIDLMGPLLSRLGQQFENTPSQEPGLFQKLNKEYFNRIDAIQFAYTHDDGLRSNELHKAEIVLVGVSRTFKTPLSIYFASRGWFVANIPIVTGIEPPGELFKIPPEHVFCLTNSPRRLSLLRKAREEHLGNQTGNYANIKYVKEELDYANSIFNRQPLWPVIKVTGKAIEEIATEILAIKGGQKS